MRSYAVLGIGRFGREIALELSRQGAEVLAIDRDHKVVEEMADQVTRAAAANIRDKDALAELGVNDCDCVILAVGSDLATSVLAVMNLKALGVRQLICKAYDETHRAVLLKLGADQVLIPEQEFARKLASQLISPRVQDYFAFSDGIRIEEILAPDSWAGSTIGDLRLRNAFGVDVITLRHGQDVTAAPTAGTLISRGDSLILLGEEKALEKVRQIR